MKLAEIILKDKGMSALSNHILTCFGGDIDLCECTASRLNRLKAHLTENVCRNSARVYLANIKAVLNLYREEENIPCRDLSVLSVKGESTISVWLDTQELQRLQDVATALQGKERMYAFYFLCSAWCGARVSDIQRIKASNIVGGRLRYVCQKTGARAEVPVKAGLKSWLTDLEMLRSSYEFCERTYNRVIKRICKEANITDRVTAFRGGKEIISRKYEIVSTHTARRSFATNLYLAGVDIYTIGRMMGHSSVEMTRRYICSGIRDMDAATKAFFA